MDMDVRSLTRRFPKTALAVVVLAAAGAVCPARPRCPRRRRARLRAELQNEARRTRAQMERLNAEMKVVTRKWEAARQRLDEVNASSSRPGVS